MTTNKLRDSSRNFNLSTLMDSLKHYKGLKAKIVTLDDLEKERGRDLQEKIRNGIIKEYKKYGLKYLLLVGDEKEIPSRKMYAKILGYNGSWQVIEGNIPADIYYSCLDGNFNSNGNSKFGEPTDGPNGGDVDFMCELTVGRFPVENSRELEHVIFKTVSHYQNNENRPKNLLLLGEKLFSELGLWGGDYMNQLIGETEDHNFITHGFNQSWKIDKLYERETSWSGRTVKKYVKSNNYLMINHLGHSNDTYTMKIYSWFFSGFENHNPFFLYTQGCFAGNFASNDSIVEDFVLHSKGAVAAVANSHYGLGPEDPDPDSTVTPGASQILNRYFVHYLSNPELGKGLGLGYYHQKSKEEIIPYINSPEARWVTFVANYLGDPALNL